MAILGKTRSGKSVCASLLTARFAGLWAYDRKHEMNTPRGPSVPNAKVAHGLTELRRQVAAQKGAPGRIIYRPTSGDLAEFDEFCRLALHTGRLCVWVDEAASVSTASALARWHGEIMRVGAALGVGCVNLSQRPAHVHNTLLSEAEHLFVYRLNLPDDRRKVAGIIGPAALDAHRLPPHHFLYYGPDLDEPIRCQPLPYRR